MSTANLSIKTGLDWLSVAAQILELKKSIPNSWMSKISQVRAYEPQNDATTLLGGRCVYLTLVKQKYEPPLYTKTWEHTFKLSEHYNWKNTWLLKLCKTKDNKLTQFNYKFLLNILPNRKNLFVWKILNDNLCLVCGEIEDSEHMFYKCSRVRNFWKSIGTLLTKLGYDPNLISWDNLVLGYFPEKTYTLSLNIVLMYAMYCIFTTWCKAHHNRETLLATSIYNEFARKIHFKKSISNRDELKNIAENL